MIAKNRIVQNDLNIRKLNIQKSPKRGGSSDIDAAPYLKKLNVEITEGRQPIQFTNNINEHIHRWAPYVQGFSASFVQSVFNQYKHEYKNPTVLDPFAGCGTVLVQAKINGYDSLGTELNPLLHFIANTKLNCWGVSPADLLRTYDSLDKSNGSYEAPSFLKSQKQFDDQVLKNLERIKGSIESFSPETAKERKIKDLIRLAFSAILIDCSKLKRTPCLGYLKDKKVEDTAPFSLLNRKINEIASDLEIINFQFRDFIDTESKVILADAKFHNHNHRFDLVITSPPYMNGLDYVMNYKIEMGWLGFANDQNELKKIKDQMVVCDNVSKGLIKNFSGFLTPKYTNDWIEEIKASILHNINKRGSYRRTDMPYIVHKYFDDMHRVMSHVVPSLNPGGRFILVVGDSLIANVYVPTDLLIAQIGREVGLEIEKIEKARTRRSGQIRSYRLRETIITLKKR